MAKKVSGGPNWLLIAGGGGIVLAIAAVVAFFAFTPDSTPDLDKVATCLPGPVSEVRAQSKAAERSPGDVVVYLDASGGMAGYAAGLPNAIGDFSKLSNDFTQSGFYPSGKKGKVTFRKFGEYSFDQSAPVAPAAIADTDAFARPAAYTEQDSRIADLLQWIKHERSKGTAPLSVIVTDLMLDDREAVAQFEALVGGALRNMIIEDDLALGIMAVRVPFAGKIFFGNTGVEANLVDRPLVIMMIGDPYQVRTFYEYLGTTGTAPFKSATPLSDRAFALFGLEAGSIVLTDPEVQGLSRAFSQLPARTRVPGAQDIPSVRFDASAEETKAGAGPVFAVEANAGVADYEVIGNKPVYSASVWKLDARGVTPEKCKTDAAWINVGALPTSGWKVSGQKVTYALTADEMEQAGLTAKGLYLVQIVAGQQGVVKDHSAAAWMQEWSMDNAQIAARLERSSGARRIGVPGLEPLRGILLAELTIPGSEKIRRTASHLIIETE